ncbi:MAG TPA: hypothetical protein DDX29_00035 [Clostridiales bacterium]|nr:hypothetical protein [Clostridiales bacterium]
MRYKGILHNVLNDAPFIGAIIIAYNCHMSCKDCINEHLKKDVYTISNSTSEIIEQVKLNSLNEGIILSGLEWTEQPDDLVELVQAALADNLKVMVYTHHTESDFFKIVPELRHRSIYVKFGLYELSLKHDQYFSHAVKLATTNQYIKYYGVEMINVDD